MVLVNSNNIVDMLAVLYIHFWFLASKNFKNYRLSNRLMLRVPDEGHAKKQRVVFTNLDIYVSVIFFTSQHISNELVHLTFCNGVTILNYYA